MHIELGKDIVGADGDKIGVVDGLVMDPRSGEVRSIVLRKGMFFPSDLIVPMESVTGADAERVTVNFTTKEASSMREYMDADFMTPPAGYFPADGVYMWPRANVFAANYVNDQNLTVQDELEERDPDAVLVTEGTRVVDAAGEDIGRVTELATDERGLVSGFRVEEGLFRHHERFIPVHFIVAADDRVVTLSVAKSEIEELHDRQK